MWTIIHPPTEFKIALAKLKKPHVNKKLTRRQNLNAKKKVYIHAKAAYMIYMIDTIYQEEFSDSSDDKDSSNLVSSYSSEGSNIS
jgi:hypothetical protein